MRRRALRQLVDIVWQHATESAAVPSTKTADMLIDKSPVSSTLWGDANEIQSSDGGVESQTRKEPSAEREQSLIAAGPKDLGVAPGPSEGHSARTVFSSKNRDAE